MEPAQHIGRNEATDQDQNNFCSLFIFLSSVKKK
jgi:hypothetical protein